MEPPQGDPPPMPAASSSSVRVCCRFRPANHLENDHESVRAFKISGNQVESNGYDQEVFSFDSVFDDTALQQDVYEFCARPLVDDVLDGYNCTIFAYGQTGSGKTHTMMGPAMDSDLKGVIPRIAEDIFVAMRQASADTEFTIKVCFVEIYMERIRDLLNPQDQNLRIREDKNYGITVEGAQELYVSSSAELLQAAARGSACRAIASTRMNQDSSRSHSVFMVTVNQRTESTSKNGKLFLVDLAGSEMVGKTGATGNVLQEAKMINRSLSALGNVIKALTENSKHIPYRDSKLTRLLQDSLGGNSKTSLVITASCFSYNAPETLSTLRFGARAKNIKNKPKVNQEISVQEYKLMVKDLGSYARSLEVKLGVDISLSPLNDMPDNTEFSRRLSQSPRPENNSKSKLMPNENSSLLAQADIALTIVLENQSKLESNLKAKESEIVSIQNILEDTQSECEIQKVAFQELKDQKEECDISLRTIMEERDELTRRIGDLSLDNSKSGFEIEDLKLAVSNLQAANHMLLAAGKVNKEPVGVVEDLQSDLQKLTNKYIELRFEHIETKDVLGSMLNEEDFTLLNELQNVKSRETKAHDDLRDAMMQMEIYRQNEVHMSLKMKNRQNQIEFLEVALHDYQDSFKTNTENYQEQVSKLQLELSQYKLLLESEESHARITKPVRGESIVSPNSAGGRSSPKSGGRRFDF